MNENPGFGVMIGMSGGNKETVDTHLGAIGKIIEKAYIENDVLFLLFTDKTGIKIWDDGQSCCENRYMHTDDNPADFVGAVFTGCELRDAPSIEKDYSVHEIQFLLVNTDKGTFVLETHNEHNGYYGGFWVVIRPI